MSAIGPFTFNGLRIYRDHLLTMRKQFRFPRSKKRRIRSKWAKRISNSRELPMNTLIQINDGMGRAFIGHPATIDALIRRAEMESTP